MTITVTPTVDTGNWPPRVRLDVAASAGETSTTVNRLNANGSTTPVRTTDGNPLTVSGTAVLYDYEMGFGDAVAYTSAESPTVVSAQVTVSVPQVWLIHPGVPALSMPVDLRPGTLQDESYAVSQGVFNVMGRTNPVVVTSGARQGAQAQLVVMVQTDVDRQALLALVSDANTLLLNIPSDVMQLGFSTCYIAVGNVKLSRWSDTVIDWNRDVVLPFTVVDRPAGGSQAQRVWADVIAAFPSWTAVMAAYPSWTATIAGP